MVCGFCAFSSKKNTIFSHKVIGLQRRCRSHSHHLPSSHSRSAPVNTQHQLNCYSFLHWQTGLLLGSDIGSCLSFSNTGRYQHLLLYAFALWFCYKFQGHLEAYEHLKNLQLKWKHWKQHRLLSEAVRRRINQVYDFTKSVQYILNLSFTLAGNLVYVFALTLWHMRGNSEVFSI